MAVEKLTPERRKQLTRDALVDAAAEVFGRRGFEGASLDEIAETAGFTRGAIYKHFDNKEDLFFAVNDRINERALAGFAELLDTDPMGSDLDAVTRQWRAMNGRNPQEFALFLEFNLYAMRNPEVRARVRDHQQATTHLVAEFIRERSAAAGVRLKYGPEVLARIFLITSDGFNQAAQLDDNVIDLYRTFLELIWGALIEPDNLP